MDAWRQKPFPVEKGLRPIGFTVGCRHDPGQKPFPVEKGLRRLEEAHDGCGVRQKPSPVEKGLRLKKFRPSVQVRQFKSHSLLRRD